MATAAVSDLIEEQAVNPLSLSSSQISPETILAQLPVRTTLFQSGMLKLKSINETAEFPQQFQQRPTVSLWLSGRSGIKRVPQECLAISATGSVIFRYQIHHN